MPSRAASPRSVPGFDAAPQLLECVPDPRIAGDANTPPPAALVLRPPPTTTPAERRRVRLNFQTFLAQRWESQHRRAGGLQPFAPLSPRPAPPPHRPRNPRRHIGVLADNLSPCAKRDWRHRLGDEHTEVCFYSVHQPQSEAEAKFPGRFTRFRREPALVTSLSSHWRAPRQQSPRRLRAAHALLVKRELRTMEKRQLSERLQYGKRTRHNPQLPSAEAEEEENEEESDDGEDSLPIPMSHISQEGRPSVLCSLHTFRKLGASVAELDPACVVEAAQRLRQPGLPEDLDVAAFASALSGVPYRARSSGTFRLPFVSSYEVRTGPVGKPGSLQKLNRDNSEWERLFRSLCWEDTVAAQRTSRLSLRLLTRGLDAVLSPSDPALFLRYAFTAIAVARTVPAAALRLVHDMYAEAARSTGHDSGAVCADIQNILALAVAMEAEGAGRMHLSRISHEINAAPALVRALGDAAREFHHSDG